MRNKMLSIGMMEMKENTLRAADMKLNSSEPIKYFL